MRNPGPHDNPFDLNKASDFTDREIAEQWVDLATSTGGLLGILKPTLRTPMLLLGGKGSGKTHLMRYCSAPVQAARRGGDLRLAVEQDGFVGIYVRADALNTDKFAGDGQNEAFWTGVFSMYFELWLATALVGTVSEYIRDGGTGVDEGALAAAVGELFDVDVSRSFTDLASLVVYMTTVRKAVDYAVNNSSLSGEAPAIEILFSPGRLVFGIPELVAERVGGLANVLVVYLIDEVENFTAGQQRFLNSLIRYRRGNATIKLGARLYGVKTLDTLGAGEPIKRDAEYERVELDRLLREHRAEYKRMVGRLVSKRLTAAGMGGEDLDERSLPHQFAQIDGSDYWRSVQNDLLASRATDAPTPFGEQLERDLLGLPGMDRDGTRAVAQELRVDDHLFLEKAAHFHFRKRWPSTVEQALELARGAGAQARALAAGDREGGSDLRQTIRYFGSDILAQLYHDFQRRVPYAGFDTLVGLSQGVARNLLTDLKHTYRRSIFAGEAPFAGGLISIRSQSDGVRDGAAWFWEDAQPPSGGLHVREAVESIAVLFRTVRLSHAPSECDLCTFSVASEALTENSRRTLQVAENWSYLIRFSEGRRNKNRRSLDEKYQLGPMLAPRWEVAEHRRGSIELSPELANAIFDHTLRASLPTLMKKRLARMLAPPTRGAVELFDR